MLCQEQQSFYENFKFQKSVKNSNFKNPLKIQIFKIRYKFKIKKVVINNDNLRIIEIRKCQNKSMSPILN